MNAHNKEKFKEAASHEIDKKWLDLISFQACFIIAWHVIFRTRRGCLFLSCLQRGMSGTAAYGYAFKTKMSMVANMLDDHGWQVSFGKLD